MGLKAILDNLDDVEEQLRGLYVEKDGKFVLQVENPDNLPEIVALKNAFERQKADNASLKNANAELKSKVDGLPEDFSVEEWDRLKAFEEETKKNLDDDETKRAREAEIQSIKAMHAQEIERLKNKREKDVGDLEKKIKDKDAVIHRLLVDEGLAKALASVGVKKEYLKAANAMLAKSVKVVEQDGELVAVVETDLGPVPVGEFVEQWSKSDEGKHFVEPPRGADAPGGGHGFSAADNPFTKAKWNLTKQSQVMLQDMEKANRMARAAGHKDAESAREEDAK